MTNDCPKKTGWDACRSCRIAGPYLSEHKSVIVFQKLKDESDDYKARFAEAQAERDFLKRQLSSSVPNVSLIS